MNDGTDTGKRAFAALRRFVRPRPQAERCELCSAALAAQHEHLIEPATRRLLCCCTACVLLFSGRHDTRFRRVPRHVQYLRGFSQTDAEWEDLHLPINLAYFFRSSSAGRVVAIYPSPAGAMESLLTLDAWRSLEEANPALRELEADVEALLVNRIGPARDYFRVPIDECYALVGLIRTHWRGLSGGSDVWETIAKFFRKLKERAGADA
jgi:hypothetical protein